MLSLGSRTVVAAAVAALLWAWPASAVPQFTPSATSLLHTLGSGQPGADWDTAGTSGGNPQNVDYVQGTGALTITAGLDNMNWFDPSNGLCLTDSGSNCAFNFSPNLDIELKANYHGAVITVLSGTLASGIINVQFNFETTTGTDLTVKDPSDGNSLQLQGNIQAGLFGGNPTTGLSASVVYNTATDTALSEVNGNAFLSLDAGTSYASLFGPDYLGLTLASLDFGSPAALDQLVEDSLNAGELVSFTAEGEGQVFRTTSADFVPEPATWMMLGMGLAGLLGMSRRRS